MKQNSWLSEIPYYETKEFSAVLRGQRIPFVSKPGIPDWDVVTLATELLADAVEVSPASRVLLSGCGHGALGVALARQAPQGEVVLTDTNFVAGKMTEMTLKLNGITNAFVRRDAPVLPGFAGAFDVVAMILPKGRQLARKLLVEAHTSLKPGGKLYLAGGKQQGINPAISDAAALFGNAGVLAYKKGERVAVAIKGKTEPGKDSWVGEPGISPRSWYEFETTVLQNTFRLRSLPGVFAYDKLDEGTRLLCENLAIPASARVLDVGCGYGIIGLLAARLGAQQVDLVDSDLLAVACARENIRLNKTRNVEAILSDLMSEVAGRKYQLVLSNPPFHIGTPTDSTVAHALIESAHHVLESGGRLIIVANRFLQYRHPIQTVFGNVQCLAETKGYYVLSSKKQN